MENQRGSHGGNQASNKHVLAVEDRVPGGRCVLGQAAGPGRKQRRRGLGSNSNLATHQLSVLGEALPPPKRGLFIKEGSERLWPG